MAGGPAEVPPPEVADEGGMSPAHAGRVTRFPFFDEQKTDPGYIDRGGKFSLSDYYQTLCEHNAGQGLE